MRKLYLASFGFKVGDNEFEELRLVASMAVGIENVTHDAIAKWKKEFEGTERELLWAKAHQTLNDDLFKAQEQTVKNPGPGLYKLRTEYNESAGDGPYSVYIATDKDPDNALLAGYGFAYFEALENFMKNMEDTRFDFDENLNVIDPVIYHSKK